MSLKCINRIAFLKTQAVTLAACNFLHVDSNKHKKYRDFKKLSQIKRERITSLKAKYDRLDVEDRPTGCLLCPHRNPHVELDYKNVRLLSQFVSPHTGRIFGSKITGLCPRKQKEVSKNIRRAQKVGLMPVTMKYFDFHSDPQLF